MREPKTDKSTKNPTPNQPQPAAILIVEDEAPLRGLMRELLSSEGYRVLEAENGVQGLACVRKQRPDLILLDIHLPDADGREVCRSIKSESGAAAPLVIHLTGAAAPAEVRVTALASGADAFVSKPVCPAELLAWVKSLLRLKRAEDQFAVHKHFESALVDSLEVGIVACDQHGSITAINRAARHMLGLRREFLLPDQLPDRCEIYHEDGVTAVSREDLPIFRALRGETIRNLELVVKLHEGRQRIVQVTGRPIHDASGNKLGAVVAMQDITELRATEQALRQQARLLELARDAIIVRDMDDRVTYWNQGAADLYGWTSQEAVGRSFVELIIKDEKAYWENRAMLLSRGHHVTDAARRTKEGRDVLVSNRCTLIRDKRGRPVSIFSINTDITEKHRIEQQLLRAQRMESIGTLAGGMAHDLNNVLTPILVSVQYLRSLFSGGTEANLLELMENSAKHGSDIVRQVLTFARGVEGQRESLQLEPLIREISQIARDTFPRTIEVRVDMAGELAGVIGDATQVKQVLLNLLVNARDAMPSGGTIHVTARTVTLDDAAAQRTPDAKPGRYALVAVQDQGLGISEDILDKIFEPFFTTKEKGQGTGLGLSTSLGIVRSHGGFFRVESQIGQGSVFEVYLPAETQIPPSGAPPVRTQDNA